MRYKINKRNGMVGSIRMLPVFLVAAVALIFGAASTDSWAGFVCPVELEEAEIFFEINATDGDGGIQLFLDGEAWKRVTIFTPDWSRHVTVRAGGNLRLQGLTELFSESGEPSFDEQPLEELLKLFPPGVYHFLGLTVEGKWLKGKATLTHVLPCAPAITWPPEDVLPTGEFVIKWEPVTSPLEAVTVDKYGEVDEVICEQNGEENGIDIVGYEVVAEIVIEEDGDEVVFLNTATLPALVKQLTVSTEFTRLANHYKEHDVLKELKIEVIAQEESGNKTITERILYEKDDEEDGE